MKAKLVISILLLWSFLSIKVKGQTAVTFKQAIAIARANNPELKIEKFNEAIAIPDILTANLRPNLILNNQTLALPRRDLLEPNTKAFNPLNTQTYWQLSKEIIPPAQWKKKVSLLELNIKLLEKKYGELERELFLQVGSKWVEAWYSKITTNLITKAAGSIDSLVSIKIARKDKPTAVNELVRIKLLADQYRLQIKTAQQNHNDDLYSLKLLTGAKGTVSIDITDGFLDALLTGKTDTLIYAAVSKRDDLQAAHQNIAIAKKNVAYQKALALPIPEVGVIYNPQNGIPYIGFYGNIEIPVFYRNQGDIQKSKILEQQAEQQLDLTLQQIAIEVKAAIASYQLQKQNLEEYKSIGNKSEKVLNTVKYAYIRGETTLMDFLEAQRSWLDTQKMYYEAISSYRKSAVYLMYVTGIISF